MLHTDLTDRLVRMLSPTELNRRKRQKLVKLISEYVPEDRLLRILDGTYTGPLTEGNLRAGNGLVKKLGPSVAPSAPPPAPVPVYVDVGEAVEVSRAAAKEVITDGVKDVRKGVVKMQEHEDRCHSKF